MEDSIKKVNFIINLVNGVSAMTEKDINDARKIGYYLKKYENGDVYYGQMDGDKPVGQGLYFFASGDNQPYFYKGNFDNGQFSGLGKLCKILNDK